HYYLLVLLCFIMIFLPANAWFSVDAKQKPEIRSHTAPYWTHFILIAQLAIVYFYAAIAKIYPDWLDGRPLQIWFGYKKDYFLIGPLFTNDIFITVIKYGGILFDLLVIPLLLFKPTRKFAILASFVFHLFNSAVFQIGTFPYMMLAFLLFFVDPDWLRSKVFKSKPQLDLTIERETITRGQNYFIVTCVLIYLIIQVLLPLRHWLYNGNVHWTEEGHRLSWRMMLRSKSGTFYCKVKADSIDKYVAPGQFLTRVQVQKIATRPDMLWQFAKFLGNHYEAKGYKDVKVYIYSRVQLNGHKEQLLIDPEVALNKEPWNVFLPSPWILPFERD
ncbi:MAG TPA: HTTM domain-containing protein, partial [Cytophagaceae bacterium]